MRLIATSLKYLCGLVLLCAVAIATYINFAPTFGAAPSGESLARIQASENYKDGEFQNLVRTELDTSSEDNPRQLSAFFSPPANKNPQSVLPAVALEVEQLKPGKFAWLGHSTVLFNVEGKMLLADPIFHRASPVPTIGEPFATQHTARVEELPPIDLVIISHDHYDHLDHLTVQKLRAKTRQFYVPLGLAAHLQRWGVASEKITEFDWYQSANFEGIELTLTPTRHFSGRGITNRFSTLWGSWVVKSNTQSIYFSGDSGYFEEFKKIGQDYGPFDIAFVENGAYNSTWAQVHMLPEQAVQASIDLNAKLLFPIHWGKFDLALHPWDEPIKRAQSAAQAQRVNMATPLIGQVFGVDEPPQLSWWEQVD